MPYPKTKKLRFKVTAKSIDNNTCMIQVLDRKTDMSYTRFCNRKPEALKDVVQWFIKEINKCQ